MNKVKILKRTRAIAEISTQKCVHAPMNWRNSKPKRSHSSYASAEADPGEGLRGLQPPLWAAFVLLFCFILPKNKK